MGSEPCALLEPANGLLHHVLILGRVEDVLDRSHRRAPHNVEYVAVVQVSVYLCRGGWAACRPSVPREAYLYGIGMSDCVNL